MAGYALSPAARADVEEIWDYTVRNWGEAQAERYTRDLRDACEALGNGTLSGRSAEDIRAGYRRAAVGSHVMFYRVRADVARIFHRCPAADANLLAVAGHSLKPLHPTHLGGATSSRAGSTRVRGVPWPAR